MIRQLRMMLADRWRTLCFAPTKHQIDFAFILHPRDATDVRKKYPFLKIFPDFFVSWCMRFFWPIRVAPIHGLKTKDGKQLRGVVIASPLLPKQMMKNRALASKMTVRAVELAKKNGAKRVGLGGLTASLTRGGLDIVDKIDISVTTGRFFTIYNVSNLAKRALQTVGISKDEATIAIVGAGGSIGAGSAQLLQRYGYKKFLLVDVSHKKNDVQSLISYMQSQDESCVIKYHSTLDVLPKADCIVTATNHPNALVCKHHIKKGVIIVDDAQPSDVEEDLFTDIEYLVLEGGVVHSKSIHIPFDFGLQEKGDIFSCLAELLILTASESKVQSPLGRSIFLNDTIMDLIERESKVLSFDVGSFQNAKKVYSESDIKHIKEICSRR